MTAAAQHWDEEQGQREVVESALEAAYFEPDYDPARDDSGPDDLDVSTYDEEVQA